MTTDLQRAIGRTGPATPEAESIATLTGLSRAGRLAAEYPRVQELLATLPATDLPRAGNLLSRLDPGDVLREHPATPTVSVAVTGHGTLAPLHGPLAVELARHGLLLRLTTGDFGSWVVDLSDPGSELRRAGCDLVLCVLDPGIVTDELPTPWRVDDAERVLAEKTALLERIAAGFARTGTGTLVLNTLPLPATLTAQLVDHRSRARLGAAWREANARLLRLTGAHPGTVVLDTDPLTAEGIPATDARLSTYTRTHLSPQLLARYAREVGHLARHTTGRTRKCLVLDLDGTLWGGVLGDVGPDGVEVADTYRGEAFRAFQTVVKQIGSQGVLLAVASKNDRDAVEHALRANPRMTLREDDFVRIAADWGPKHESLRALAADLNIGVDSLVFVDDSPFECGLVRSGLPGTAVVQLDGDPALHVGRLLADGWFDTLELTTEDRQRPARYRDEMARKDFLGSFTLVEDYLHELDVHVRLAEATAAEVPRVSQLTLRTNQFNMTTRRLQPADVEALRADPAATVLTITTRDRFGDNGLVGAVLLRREGDREHIENFLLSCRVFSRGIEQACLAAVLRRAAATGAREVVAAYRPTAKNAKVRDFYPRNGFTQTPDGTGTDAATTFHHDLRDLPEPPAHIHLTAFPAGGDR
jgi:FkbH-like protein